MHSCGMRSIMLPVFLASIVMMATDCVCAQTMDQDAGRKASNSISERPPSDTHRQTLLDKWTARTVGTFGPRALFEPVFPATYWIASPPDHYPREWRQGVAGFARNYGEELVSKVAFQTARAASGAPLHEDIRYHRAAIRNPLLGAGAGL
jgi:hypothetical protein